MRALLLCLVITFSCGRRHGGGGAPEDGATLHPQSGDTQVGGDSATGDDVAGDPAGDASAVGDASSMGDPQGAGDSSSSGDSTSVGDPASSGDPASAGDPSSPGDPVQTGDPGGTEVWLEVDYYGRNPAESPTTVSWSASNTPGWSESNWAPDGSSWAYIHVPDGGDLTSDPIGGTVLELGCHDRFRLFFGLEELWHVGAATVTVEGRSRATSSSVDFEVWNPGGTSGFVAYGSMSNDWTADVVTVDFVAEAGDGFQAVEIAPIARSCNLAIRRVRLTLYDID